MVLSPKRELLQPRVLQSVQADHDSVHSLTQAAQAGLLLPANPSAVFLTSYATVLSLLISIAKHLLGDELFSNASAVIYTNTCFPKGNRGKR